jgi:hypothetical protein
MFFPKKVSLIMGRYRAFKQFVFFGNYFIHTNRGVITEGDEVQIINSAPWMVVKDAIANANTDPSANTSGNNEPANTNS